MNTQTKTWKHTPGPWTFFAILSGSENHKGFRVNDEQDCWIADVSPRDADGDVGNANARLIAAAPELLDCLKAALPLIDDAFQDAQGCATTSDAMAGVCESFRLQAEAARDAIAKVEGKAER